MGCGCGGKKKPKVQPPVKPQAQGGPAVWTGK